MTDKELDCFGEGYAECRLRLIKDLRTILNNTSDVRQAIQVLTEELVDEASKEHWETIKIDSIQKSQSEFEKLLVEFHLEDRRRYLVKTNQTGLKLV
jgi:glutamyl-tRNA reductase